MLPFFKTPQVIQASTADSIFESFHWALDSFDAYTFVHHTELVLPNSRFFPDKANNELDMAKAIYRRVLGYAGLPHWPFALIPQEHFQAAAPAFLGLDYQSRSPRSNTTDIVFNGVNQLHLTYSSAMMKKPMDLVATMSNLVAQHYLLQSRLVPPAGEESFNETAEIISVFMGFGVMVANSAYTFRGSCARCYDPRANRNAALSEHEAVFALALFSLLKQIPTHNVTPSLKPYLRATFKKAIKQIKANKIALDTLQDKLNDYPQKAIGAHT